ncbi:MAG: BamA/TamA family outer membrane protein [Cyclobacteriaceae bacterium]
MKKVFAATLLTLILSIGAFPLLSQSIPDPPNINLDTVQNNLVTINNIFILGNEKTQESIITRELSFSKGDTISMHRLIGFQTEDRNKIYNTNLFNTVEIQILELDSENVDILIKLTERWYLYPGIIFRTSAGDRNFTNWWKNENHDLSRVNYGFNLSKYNLRGRDETVLLTAQFGFEKVFLLNYVVPYIDKNQKFGLITDIGYSEYKNLPYRTIDHYPRFILSEDIQRKSFGTSLSLSYRGSFYTRHFITTGFNTSTITDSVKVANPEYFNGKRTTQRYLRLSYSYTRDYRDNHTYPLRGNYISATLGRSGLGVFNDFNRWYLYASFYQYFDLGRKFFLGTNVSAHFSTKDVPYSRYLALGYENYIVRGYELNVVEGPQALLFKSSLKKRLFKTAATIPDDWMPMKQFRRWPLALYLKTFFDAAYVNNYPNYELNSRLSNKPIYSVGLGLDFVTIHDLTIRLEESYNAEGQFNFVLGFKHDL